jgi:hypothetical protein
VMMMSMMKMKNGDDVDDQGNDEDSYDLSISSRGILS